MPVTDTTLDDVFAYHSPSPEQLESYTAIRFSARQFSHTILTHTPPSADQQAALRHVREATFTANAAISLKGLI